MTVTNVRTRADNAHTYQIVTMLENFIFIFSRKEYESISRLWRKEVAKGLQKLQSKEKGNNCFKRFGAKIALLLFIQMYNNKSAVFLV